MSLVEYENGTLHLHVKRNGLLGHQDGRWFHQFSLFFPTFHLRLLFSSSVSITIAIQSKIISNFLWCRCKPYVHIGGQLVIGSSHYCVFKCNSFTSNVKLCKALDHSAFVSAGSLRSAWCVRALNQQSRLSPIPAAPVKQVTHSPATRTLALHQWLLLLCHEQHLLWHKTQLKNWIALGKILNSTGHWNSLIQTK